MKKVLTTLFLLVSMALVIAGCGGGGGGGSKPSPTPITSPDVSASPSPGSSDPTPTPTATLSPTPTTRIYSNDYFGLEIGAQLTYHSEGFDPEETPSSFNMQWIQTVLREVPGKPGIFQTKSSVPDLPNESGGEFIEKDGSTYYDRGWWEVEGGIYTERWDDHDKIVANPLSQGFISDWWGTAQRQELVTVPAGTFQAWYFVEEFPDSKSEIWFVPNIGVVKEVYFYKEDGVTVSKYWTNELTSIRYGVDTSGMVPSGQFGMSSKSLRPSDPTPKNHRFSLHPRRK